MPRIHILPFLLALIFHGPTAAGNLLVAQSVERTGAADNAVDRRIDALLESRDYLLVTTDTAIPRGATVPSSLLVLNATLILEGSIAGNLIGVGANLFLRPDARVEGDVVNAGGGLYRSALAEIGGTVIDRTNADYRVERRGALLRIVGAGEDERLVLDGFRGFWPPTYDRVDALGLRWGATYFPAVEYGVQPRVHGWAGYLSGRGELVGGAELAFQRGNSEIAAGAYRETATNDEWIRGDLRNSISFLLAGKDYRNYFDARRLYARVGHRFGRDPSFLTLSLTGRWEDASSLGTGDPWTLFGDDPRFNPPIDDGVISSLILGTDGEWLGSRAAWEGSAWLEFAGEALGGDFTFGQFVLLGEWAMDALADHILEIEWYFQGPLPGTESLPRQRWSIIGGSGTLPTFSAGEFRGDRVAFVESKYIIPLPERLRLPIIGVPDLQLIHAFGMAWTDTLKRDLEQNLSIRLQFFGPYARVVYNPADRFEDIEFDVGISWPFDGRYPWRLDR